MTQQKREAIRKGIAAYQAEQDEILAMIRDSGGLTCDAFDKAFMGKQFERGLPRFGLKGDSFILGGMHGVYSWEWWLALLQAMMAVGLVSTESRDGVLTYVLAEEQ